jgi:hypothetical protein
VLKNISVMVPGPAFDAAVLLLKDLKGVSLGLHVTLNAEWDPIKWGPVLPRDQVPSLVDAKGYFHPAPMVMHQRGFSVDEAMAEVAAQLADARAQGLNIEYLDEHMGVGWLPGLGDALAELSQREGLVYAPKLPGFPGGPEHVDPVCRFFGSLDAAAPDTYLIVTHPSFDSEEMRLCCAEGTPPGEVGRERERDRRLLTDPALAEGLREREITSIRYIDL